MCAIVDRNVVGELLKQTHEAARGFYQWLVGRGALVVGGQELREAFYKRNNDKERYIVNELRSAGKIIEEEDDNVEQEAIELRKTNSCKSNDEHIIALAQLSGARLLYSNDRVLHKDFLNKELIDNPRGTVYSTLKDTGLSGTHRKILQRHVCSVRD